jgi:uncharacterized protein (DUF433 family)
VRVLVSKLNHITVDRSILDGRPVLKTTSIPLAALIAHLANDGTVQDFSNKLQISKTLCSDALLEVAAILNKGGADSNEIVGTGGYFN